jgi:hypothetical protein
MAAFAYTAFGLHLATNRPVPGLLPPTSTPAPQVQVWFDAPPPESPGPPEADCLWYPTPDHPSPHAGLTVWLLGGGRGFRFLYDEGAEFYIDRTGTAVWARWTAALTFEDAVTYLLGPVLGFVLRLHGRTCLHASAVAVGGRALALVGPVGAGKSTTAAALAGRGCPALADDVLALEPQGDVLLAHPAYPRLRLWPESARQLYGSPDALPPLTPTWDKRYLDVAGSGLFERRAVPLGAVYLLGERSATAGAPAVGPLPPAGRLFALARNTYLNFLLDKAMRAREFALLGRVAAAVPLRRATPHADPDRLERLCDLLLEDFRALDTPS